MSDIRLEAKNLARSPRTGIPNPFEGMQPLNKWQEGIRNRYIQADTELGRTHMIVAWYSKTFRDSLLKADDYQWYRVLIRLKNYRASLMALAVTNNLNPRDHYRGSEPARLVVA